jgi:GntR family transcriptional regulator
MILHIQPDGPVPIYEQIVTQVTFAIATGTLRPGEAIPSVRDLGHELVVNPNTVMRAYQKLESDGIVVARRGRPMEVTAQAPALCEQQRLRIVRERIRAALREAVNSGLKSVEIKQVVEEELARAHGGAGQFREKR